MHAPEASRIIGDVQSINPERFSEGKGEDDFFEILVEKFAANG